MYKILLLDTYVTPHYHFVNGQLDDLYNENDLSQ